MTVLRVFRNIVDFLFFDFSLCSHFLLGSCLHKNRFYFIKLLNLIIQTKKKWIIQNCFKNEKKAKKEKKEFKKTNGDTI